MVAKSTTEFFFVQSLQAQKGCETSCQDDMLHAKGHFHIGPVEDVPTLSVSIFSRNPRTGFKISVKVPKQTTQKPMIFQNMSNLS